MNTATTSTTNRTTEGATFHLLGAFITGLARVALRLLHFLAALLACVVLIGFIRDSSITAHYDPELDTTCYTFRLQLACVRGGPTNDHTAAPASARHQRSNA